MRNWIKQIFSAVDKKNGEAAPVQLDDGNNDKAQGDAYLQAGNFAQAVLCYRQAIAVNPTHAKAHSNLAFALNEQGLSIEAEASLARALAIDPAIADAHYLLATLLHAQGKSDDAIFHFRQALELTPDFEFAYRDLAFLLLQQGQLHDAKQVLLQGIARNPQLVDLHMYLSNLHQEERQFDLAIASLQQALSLQPERADILARMGLLLHKQNRPAQAVVALQQAVALNPQLIDAHNNLGNALQDLKRFAEAATSYRLALQIDPEFAELHNNLGNTLIDLGRLDEAIPCFHRALKIAPEFAEAHGGLGSALQEQGNYNEAIASFRRALGIMPENAENHSNLGGALKYLGQYDEAVSCYRQALIINPEHALILNNLGGLFTEIGQFEEALTCFRHAVRVNPDFFGAYSGLLFTYNFLSDQPAATMLSEAQRFGELVTQRASPYTQWDNAAVTNRRLRVGFVSGDFRKHAVGHFLENVLEAVSANFHDRLDLVGYFNHMSNDIVTDRIRACCQEWRVVLHLPDQELAKQIRDDKIDILIDLSGHTAYNRLPLFAWKPAPVQATWLGYFPTTGVSAIDYRIADPWVPQESGEAYFTEKIYRLPETYVCFSEPNADVPVLSLPALDSGYITFGSLNNLAKINDTVVALWARILLAVPNSRLYLKAPQLSGANLRQTTLERFGYHGIEAHRLILEGSSTRTEHLAAYRRVDIALDPFPLPGGTTSVEALWMGVPVLTLLGEHFLSRIGESTMQNAGLPDWIAADADDYVARAVHHASDVQRLAALHNSLRQQVLSSPLFDAQRFAMHFQAAMLDMWTRWCQQQQVPAAANE